MADKPKLAGKVTTKHPDIGVVKPKMAKVDQGDVKRARNAATVGTNVDRGTGARSLHPARNKDEMRVFEQHLNTSPGDWVDSGLRVRVHSSNVAAIRYDRPNQILYVEFRVKGVIDPNGSLYRYFGVHPLTAKSMFNTASMGKFVWYKLRDRYPYERVS